MKQYLKMADVFDCEVESDADLMYSESLGNIADFSGYKTQCRYSAHAINSHDDLVRMNQELLAALGDAATSLETIQLRSFGEDSFLDSKPEMRSYAGSRASVVRAAIAKAKGGAA